MISFVSKTALLIAAAVVYYVRVECSRVLTHVKDIDFMCEHLIVFISGKCTYKLGACVWGNSHDTNKRK